MNNQFVIAVVLIGTFATSIYFNNEVRRGTVADMRTYTDVIPHDSNKKTNTYLVQLDGTVSKDKDDDDLTYKWLLLEKPANVGEVKLYHPTEPITYFEAKEGKYTFRLVVTDSYGASSDTLQSIEIKPEPNEKPVPGIVVSAIEDIGQYSAIIDHDKDPKSEIYNLKLDASNSVDIDGDDLTYLWEQVDGHEKVELSDKDKALTYFKATPGIYTFRLTVTDAYGETASKLKVVSIGAEPNNRPIADITVSNEEKPKPQPKTKPKTSKSKKQKDEEKSKKNLLNKIGA